jgi:hypothetical protein
MRKNTTADFLRQVVEDPGGCWLWLGAKDPRGYGRFSFHGRKWLAHRFAYEALVGWVPAGLELDHLCKNKSCVNPAHLEAVTSYENKRRAGIVDKTHCKHGHAFTPENTYVDAKRRRRVCRSCGRRRWAEKQCRQAVAA